MPATLFPLPGYNGAMDADTKKTAKPRRRWFRFSMRTLLIVVTVLSVPLGWIGWRLGQERREQATIAWVEEMGGYVYGQSWFSGRVRQVYLKDTQVSDLSPLVELKNLEAIFFYRTKVNDLSPLSELKNLEGLSLYNTPVSDMSTLSELNNLEWLWFINTQVSDLSPLAEFKNLVTLILDNTQVSDLSPLAELKNLKTFWINNTQVSDLSPLAELKNLETLDLKDSQVSDEQVQELRQALPNCEIITE